MVTTEPTQISAIGNVKVQHHTSRTYIAAFQPNIDRPMKGLIIALACIGFAKIRKEEDQIAEAPLERVERPPFQFSPCFLHREC